LLSWIMPADGMLAARSTAATSARPASRSNFRSRVSEHSRQSKFVCKVIVFRRGARSDHKMLGFGGATFSP
jgi:hypothetical protein